MFEARDSDSLAFKECEKFLDEIYNGSKYSRLFGQFILTKMICHPVGFNCLNNIYLSGFLEKYIPEFQDIHLLNQDKKFGKNLWEHSLLCYTHVDEILLLFNLADLKRSIFNIDSEEVRKILYFGALLHDIGKVDDVSLHASIGASYAKDICLNFEEFVSVKNLNIIVPIVIHSHMRPLGYQRGENWSDNAIEKFIIDNYDKTISLITIILAAIDKYASSKNYIYLEPLIELFMRVYRYGFR